MKGKLIFIRMKESKILKKPITKNKKPKQKNVIFSSTNIQFTIWEQFLQINSVEIDIEVA